MKRLSDVHAMGQAVMLAVGCPGCWCVLFVALVVVGGLAEGQPAWRRVTTKVDLLQETRQGARGKIDATLYLGMANFEDNAGGPILLAEKPIQELWHPRHLGWAGSSSEDGLEVIAKPDGVIRQAVTPDVLMDVTLDEGDALGATDLVVYHRPRPLPAKVDGVYPVDGLEVRVRARFQALDVDEGGRTTALGFWSSHNDHPESLDPCRWEVTWRWQEREDEGSGWRMTIANGDEQQRRQPTSVEEHLTKVLGDQKRQSTYRLIDHNGKYDHARRVVVETMQRFSWGLRPVRREVQPLPDPNKKEHIEIEHELVEYGYYADASRDGDNYARLRWKKEGDGDWEHYRYNKNGWIIETIRRFGNNELDLTELDALRSANRVERNDEFDIDLDDVALGEGDGRPDGVERMQRIVRGEVRQARYEIDWSRSHPRGTADPEVFEFWEIDCRPGDPEVGLSTTGFLNKLLGSPDHLGHRVVKTRRYVEGHPREFDLAAVEHGDGRITMYEYPDEGMTVVTHGEANAAGDGVVSGTRVTRRVDMNGRELFEVIERKEPGGAWQTESGGGIQ